MRAGTESLARYLLVSTLMGFAFVIGVIFTGVMTGEETISCPPQTLINGSQSTIAFSYQPTLEDMTWVTGFNAWVQACNTTAQE
jgi:hypothetical protein